ncbi:cation:proton antiporter [Cytophagaceae bacterium ABcell3]|nr:cation:proton antiporter [Cytophagaceae bacterium ABcell3]
MELAPNTFTEFALILALAALIGAVGRLLKQPLIISFIVVGILAGPAGFDILSLEEEVELLAETGIAILLFAVGLKLDVALIRSTGKVAFLTGMGQVIFTSVIGYLIGLLLGYSNITSLYIAIALTFSSTIIIVKLLSDKKEIDSLHGQISLGFLIVQDIVVVLLMIVLSAYGAGAAEESTTTAMLTVFIKGIILLASIALLMKYVLPYLVHQLAKSQELLVLFAIAWAVALAAIGDSIGFSKEVGAFLAGVSLASTHYREVISGRLVALRDFLLLFFFINLGAHLDLSEMGAHILPAFVFSIFVLLGNPLIVLVIMGLMGYRRRTGFLAGLTVAQISEFSLILAALGFSLGHIDSETVGLITLVGLITIGLSTYMIIYSHPIFEKLSPMLKVFEKPVPYREAIAKQMEQKKIDAIVFGLGRYGENIAESLERENYNILGVDFDPIVVQRWQEMGRDARYGDVEDPELAEHLPLKNTKFVISTFPDVNVSISLLKYLRELDFKGKIALTAHRRSDAEKLQKHQADLILLPFAEAAVNIVSKLKSKE